MVNVGQVGVRVKKVDKIEVGDRYWTLHKGRWFGPYNVSRIEGDRAYLIRSNGTEGYNYVYSGSSFDHYVPEYEEEWPT